MEYHIFMQKNDIIETKKRAKEVLKRLSGFMNFNGRDSLSLKDLSDMFMYVTEKMEGVSMSVYSSYKEEVFDGLVASLYTFQAIVVANNTEGDLFENLRKEIKDMKNEEKDIIIVHLLVFLMAMFCSFIVYSIDAQSNDLFIDCIPIYVFNILKVLGKHCLDSLGYIDIIESKINDMKATIESLQYALKDI